MKSPAMLEPKAKVQDLARGGQRSRQDLLCAMVIRDMSFVLRIP